MRRRLYDLAGADDDCRFSPACWRVRMALAHKGLEVETVAWRFTEKEAIAASGQGKVPVLVDGDDVVHDSFEIARYLDRRYLEAPSLLGGQLGAAHARVVMHWVQTAVHPAVLRLIIGDVFLALHAKDKAYFRESREAMFGKPLEQVVAAPDEGLPALRAALAPVRATLNEQAWLGGSEPSFVDYTLFGAFMWARGVSRLQLLEDGDVVERWRRRLLDHFDGLAGSARAAA